MKFHAVPALILLLALLVWPGCVRAEEGTPRLVVLEAFTTQSCPSCVPAEKFLTELKAENQENLLIVVCHVTYQNMGEWTDTLSQKFCDGRHFGYLQRMAMPRPATPFFKIGGRRDIFGTPEDEIRSALADPAYRAESAPVGLSVDGDLLHVRLGKADLKSKADVWLVGYKKHHRETITAGLNLGRTMDFVNAVTHMFKLLSWDGSAQEFSYPLKDVRAEGYAVLVQENWQGAILGAASIEPESETGSN